MSRSRLSLRRALNKTCFFQTIVQSSVHHFHPTVHHITHMPNPLLSVCCWCGLYHQNILVPLCHPFCAIHCLLYFVLIAFLLLPHHIALHFVHKIVSSCLLWTSYLYVNHLVSSLSTFWLLSPPSSHSFHLLNSFFCDSTGHFLRLYTCQRNLLASVLL